MDPSEAKEAVATAVRRRAESLTVTGLEVNAEVLELRQRGETFAARLVCRAAIQGTGLSDVRVVEVGLGRDAMGAIQSAIDTCFDVVVPALARAIEPDARGDLELIQQVPGERAPNRWAVFLGPPQLRAEDDALEALAGLARGEQAPFAQLVATGTLPHFPSERTYHWLRLWVGRHGDRTLAQCDIDSQPWPRAHEVLADTPLPASRGPLHVLGFVVLARR